MRLFFSIKLPTRKNSASCETIASLWCNYSFCLICATHYKNHFFRSADNDGSVWMMLFFSHDSLIAKCFFLAFLSLIMHLMQRIVLGE